MNTSSDRISKAAIVYDKVKYRVLVDHAVEEMNQSGFRKDYTIISLAKKVGSNETTLKQAFKTIMKTTIYKYHQDKRMEFAVERLKDGESVGNVSSEIGYSFVGHFSYAFKKYFGKCPSDYLRMGMD